MLREIAPYWPYTDFCQVTKSLRSEEAGMLDQASAAFGPWRRYLRLSVRGLIVLVLVIGFGLGWLVRSARLQHEAVVAIGRAHGNVVYEVPFGHERFNRGLEPIWAKRLPSTLGVDAVCHVWSVRFSGYPTDADMLHVGRLTALEDLMLSSTNITDSGLVHVEGLTNLDSLYLDGTSITDAGLAHLKGLAKLRLLALHNTRITDIGLVYLQGLNNLSHLNLSDTQITDAGLAHLKGLTSLRSLDLGHDTRVSNAGVTELKQALPSVAISH